MNPKPYSKKLRSLEFAVEQYQNLPEKEGRKGKMLLRKIKQLVAVLKYQVQASKLKMALGALAVFFGLGVERANAQTFATPVMHPFGLDSISNFGFPNLGDLDGDGDLDLLVSEGYYGIFKYYENIGSATVPNFTSPVVTPWNIDTLFAFADPVMVDLDNDGDLDLLVGALDYFNYTAGGEFLYFQNTGTASSPQFSNPAKNPFGLTSTYYYNFPVVSDLDDDGDLDILSYEYYGVPVYFENLGTAGTPLFATQQKNPFGLTTHPDSSLFFPGIGDLDRDGDLDLLNGSLYYGFNFYENTGSKQAPMFAAAQSNPFGLSNPQSDFEIADLVDLDGDGDLDMLAIDYYGNFLFYENTDLNLSVMEEDLSIKVYPNPAVDILQIETNKPIDQVNIYDLNGKLVLNSNFQQELSVENLSPGLYQLELLSQEERIIKKISISR